MIMSVYKIKKKTDEANNTEEIKFPISSVDGLQSVLDALAGGGGGITEIADQYVRIWNLDAGIYKLTYNGTKYIYYSGTTSTSTRMISYKAGDEVLLIVSIGNGYKVWLLPYYTAHFYYGYTSSSSGYSSYLQFTSILQSTDCVNNLNSVSTVDALAAYQGKVIKGLIDDLQTQITELETKVDNLQPTNATVTNNSDGTVDISITNMPSS